MKTLTTAILGLMLLAGAVQADVFVSVDAKGNFVLSNVHRPGRQYERVIREAEAAVVSLDQQPQMIAARPYAELVAAAATDNQLPAALLHAVIQAESSYNASAVSPKGAGGLMQLMPDTAREMGVTVVVVAAEAAAVAMAAAAAVVTAAAAPVAVIAAATAARDTPAAQPQTPGAAAPIPNRVTITASMFRATTMGFIALVMTMAFIAQAKSAMTTVFIGPGKWATIEACTLRGKLGMIAASMSAVSRGMTNA
jgi:hypothetical protein